MGKRLIIALLAALIITSCGTYGRNDESGPETAPQKAEEASSEEDALASLPSETVPEEISPETEVSEAAAEQEGTTEAGESEARVTESQAPEDAGAEEGDPAEQAFYISEITDEIFQRIYGLSYKTDCTVPREDLAYLHLLHVTAEGETKEGEMIVNKVIAEDVLDIFRELYAASYPIEKIRLVDEYGADDELSMEDNNSSAFNFRLIPYTNTISKHGLGFAIDINTLYNPYIKTVDGVLVVQPQNAGPYTDRTQDFPYKITESDLACQLFIAHGFEWGGNWQGIKDYQHFEWPTTSILQYYPDYRG